MAAIQDFRTLSGFTLENVRKSGLGIGRGAYWKLYAVENYYRVLIHSILLAQLGNGWWALVVDPTMQRKINGFKPMYASRPWHSKPGRHDIYYTDLYDLNEIARTSAHLLRTVVPDIDQWLVKIDAIRLPRNIVAHMNFPNKNDQKRIDVLYQDVRQLMYFLDQTATITTLIP